MTQNNKPIIGVTGNSGSGKGTVCGILGRMGGFCIDADKLAHRVMEYGKPAYTEIAELFGAGIILPDNSIDRKKLGNIVFHDPGKRIILERVVHKRVSSECLSLTAAAQNLPEYAFVVWDAPLLAEAGMHMRCDTVLLVTAPFSVKLARILARDNITEEQAKLRLQNQPSDTALYEMLAGGIGRDRVKIIENSASLQELEDNIWGLQIYGY